MNEDTAQAFCAAAAKVLAELADSNKSDDSVEQVRRCTTAINVLLPMPLPPVIPELPPPPPLPPSTPVTLPPDVPAQSSSRPPL
jgi:hypothetical protein